MLCALCQFDSETSPCTACGNDYCPDCMTWHECEKPSGLYPHQERGLREIGRRSLVVGAAGAREVQRVEARVACSSGGRKVCPPGNK